MPHNQELKDQIKELQIFIFNRIVPLKLNQVTIRGQDYLSMTQSYLNMLNTQKVPEIRVAFQEMTDNQLKIIVKKLFRQY
jgi:hypothetical protein